jgi:phosphopantothenoylcysteine synthetase/decarboxylase
VTADVSTRVSRHQAKLLLNVLGLGEIWRKNSKTPDRCVIVNVDTGEVVKALSSKDNEKDFADAIAKSFAEDEDEGMDDEEDSDEGCSDEGCGD